MMWSTHYININLMFFLHAQHVISPDDYFGNYQRSTVLNTEASLKQLHDKVDKEKFMWSNPPTQVNAFYSPQVNSISKRINACLLVSIQ